MRLRSDGSVDTTFAIDDGGYRLINFDLTGLSPQVFDRATDLAIQSDGKIAAIGNVYFNLTDSDFAAVRVGDSGALDATFGGSGMVHFGVNGWDGSNAAQSLAVDAAGNLLLAGTLTGNPYGITVAPLTSSGAIDASFNSGLGYAGFSLSSPAYGGNEEAMGLDGAGHILVAGNYVSPSGSGGSVRRLTADGLLDTSFASGGPALTTPGFAIRSLLVDPDGSFVVGCEGADGSGQDVNFVRFLSDGTTDTNFGTNGVTTFPAWGRPMLIARTRRGGWLMAGAVIASNTQVGAFVAKVLANGQPDTTLNGAGFASVLYRPNTWFQAARPALTADGRLIVAGTLPIEATSGSGTMGLMRIYADYDTLFVGNFEAAQ